MHQYRLDYYASQHVGPARSTPTPDKQEDSRKEVSKAPLRPSARAPSEISRRHGAAASKLRFVVLEECGIHKRAIARELYRLGALGVHEARTGAALIESLASPPDDLDVVVLDLDSIGVDSVELIRGIAQTNASLSLILASHMDRKLVHAVGSVAQALGMQVLGVAAKPITSTTLESIIARHRGVAGTASPPAQPHRETFSHEEIAEGIARDEFEPFLQPKVDVRSFRVVGCEALVRWRHPDFGILAPHAFLPAIEADPLLDDLTWLMLRKSASTCRDWTARGIDASVAVNVSVRLFRDRHSVSRITDIVAREGVSPGQIVLELTESSAPSALASTLEGLAKLRLCGFGLAIDDFGTGYSTLQQLSRIAFTELKIDRMFVSNAVNESHSRAILSASVALARKLNIPSVAEGVESTQDWHLLRQLGCDIAQGNRISQPMEAAAFPAWVRTWYSKCDSLRAAHE
jgi:EAL domain-containing protein (putative c-di-GMP-specific phosphodiesterase class I)